ncbi:hypothetical protein Nepgr_027022 [Nepenthes gracilis]|uniref:Uncharacterized protein n=1 Tax=Nepenthes gracilis TaxID=150966 RepID=A0AAD3T9G5_NEPGR|nr:hypothetical protein Nepgr_027022 [Nepenthes gracilis]
MKDLSQNQLSMDVEKIFHMRGGHGETSYARNSSLQKEASDMVKHITMEAIQQLYLSTSPKSLVMADFGCSSGPNTLSTIRDLYQAVDGASRRVNQAAAPPELVVYLNDLPNNDFNSIFSSLPDFYGELGRHKHNAMPLFVAAFPGSFYSRVFPHNSLHFVYSSYSLHWLSKVPSEICKEKCKPINRGCIYICPKSPPQVIQAYVRQFQEDFPLFLRLRSQELISGGRMVLIFLGREGRDHIDRGSSFLWELLSRSFAILIAQGKVEEEKLDSYDVHFYAPSREEVEDEVRREGSFRLDRLETLEIGRRTGGDSPGAAIAMAVRAIQESMISHHFGEGILDSLFDTYAKLIDDELIKQDIRPLTLVLVLTKL